MCVSIYLYIYIYISVWCRSHWGAFQPGAGSHFPPGAWSLLDTCFQLFLMCRHVSNNNQTMSNNCRPFQTIKMNIRKTWRPIILNCIIRILGSQQIVFATVWELWAIVWQSLNNCKPACSISGTPKTIETTKQTIESNSKHPSSTNVFVLQY